MEQLSVQSWSLKVAAVSSSRDHFNSFKIHVWIMSINYV